MRADIWLLPGVSPVMKLQAAGGRESFVTLETSIVLLPGVSIQVCLQVT